MFICILWKTQTVTSKIRDITLLTKAHIVKTMVFPVVIYGFKSWTTKEAECRRTDAFKLWFWRRPENPLDCKKIKPVHPKENRSWIFTGRTMLKLNLQYFGHLMRRADPLEKTLMLGKTKGRKTGRHRMRWLDGIINSMDRS